MSLRSLIVALGLAACLGTASAAGPKRHLLLVGSGPDGHPRTTHEYVAGLHVLARCLEPVPDLEVTTARADGAWKEGPGLIDRADGVVLFLSEGAKWADADPERYRALSRLAARGGGLAALHWAIGTKEAGPVADFVKLLGGCHGGPDRKYKELEAAVEVADPGHPITAGVRDFRVKDEFYYRLKFVRPPEAITPLLRVPIDASKETVAWAWERPDSGRSFGFSGLHFHANWRLPEYRRLVAQGVLWTLKLPIPKDGLPVAVKREDLELKQPRP
jgi:type 1 glutamine amidotransferase